MKAISLWQPWASAIFADVKHFETRHWKMPMSLAGVKVAIHASKRDTPEIVADFDRLVRAGRPENYGAFLALRYERFRDLPLGYILGTVVFSESVPTNGGIEWSEAERDWGNYASGRFAWPIVKGSVERFQDPVPFTGKQGFFNWEPGS